MRPITTLAIDPRIYGEFHKDHMRDKDPRIYGEFHKDPMSPGSLRAYIKCIGELQLVTTDIFDRSFKLRCELGFGDLTITTWGFRWAPFPKEKREHPGWSTALYVGPPTMFLGAPAPSTLSLESVPEILLGVLGLTRATKLLENPCRLTPAYKIP